jgi:hypothetical protein
MTTNPDELANALPGALARRKEQLLQRVTFAVEGKVKERTPVLTGTLRRSETSRVEPARDRGIVGTAVIYARVVNNRRKFMERGLDDAQTTIGRILEEEGGAILGSVV